MSKKAMVTQKTVTIIFAEQDVLIQRDLQFHTDHKTNIV